ncbi:YraN family protein [Alteromonas gracilis]
MSTAHQKQNLGRYGERIAAAWLVERGMVLLDRNWRCELGELDLVLRDGDTLVFCEVKTRRNDDYGSPFEAVTPRKAQRLRVLGACWLDQHDLRVPEVRIDIVAVWQDGRGPAVVEHRAGVS